MEEIKLKLGKMYILSGVPASGKSTFLKQVPKSMVVSSDKLRDMITGEEHWTYSEENGISLRHSEEANNKVFSIMKDIIDKKCELGLTIFIDATNISDKERRDYVNIAKKHHMEYQIIIFDIPKNKLLEQDKEREFPVGEEVIENFYERFQKESEYPFIILKSAYTRVKLLPLNVIEDNELDVVGDIHGLYNETKELLNSLGYIIEDNAISHKNGRKLLFLGDFIDRGPDSLKVLDLIMKAVNSGHYAILGNHENKLIRSYKNVKNGAKEIVGGIAGKITLTNLLKRKEKYQKMVIDFLENLPFYYVYRDNLLVHANITESNLQLLSKTSCIYGSYPKKQKDTDLIYQKLFDAGINTYNLVRGHIQQISNQDNVMSLEEKQAFQGYLVAARFTNGIFTEKVRVKSEYNYKRSLRKSINFELEKLVNEKLITKKLSPNGEMSLYKYSKSVFFNNLWDKSPYLLKARGIVTDISGNIIQHPFDKVFNYGENDTGLNINNDTNVIAVEKMNGFLGNIGFDPFSKNLLVTTTGSFDSDFVGFINDFIDNKLRGKLLQYLSKNPMTLSFEVIHPEDPHIIHYESKDMGLWLIGARGLKESDLSKSEEFLDELAKEFEFKRPKHFKMNFGSLKELVKNSNIEGFMVREDNSDQKHLLKFKTPYYLTTKFIGRMGDAKIKFMYSNPKKFKESLDEEFYPIVDTLIESVSLEEFLSLENEDKISLTRDIINNMR